MATLRKVRSEPRRRPTGGRDVMRFRRSDGRRRGCHTFFDEERVQRRHHTRGRRWRMPCDDTRCACRRGGLVVGVDVSDQDRRNEQQGEKEQTLQLTAEGNGSHQYELAVPLP